MDAAVGPFQGKQGIQPFPADVFFKVYPGVRFLGKILERPDFDLRGVCDLVVLFGQKSVKVWVEQGCDLEDAGCPPTVVDIFAVGDLFIQGDRGRADLFHRVGAVCIKIRKTQQPAVVDLELVGWPGVQGKVFNSLDIRSHDVR